MSIVLVLIRLDDKSLHVGLVRFPFQWGLMHMTAIVLFCVEWTSSPNSLPCGSHSERPFVFHARRTGSSGQ